MGRQPSNSKCGNAMYGQCYGGDVCVSRHIITGAFSDSKCKSTDGIPEFDPPTPPSPDECIAHHCKGGCLQPDTQNPDKQVCHTGPWSGCRGSLQTTSLYVVPGGVKASPHAATACHRL